MMLNWIWERLKLSGVLGRRQVKITVHGLNGAGKSTLIHMLKRHFQTPTDTGLSFDIENMIVTLYDIGGFAFRNVTDEKLKETYLASDGIIYMVSCAEREIFPDTKERLQSIITMEEIRHVPILVLGNKIDYPSTASEDELLDQLGLSQTTGKGKSRLDKDVRPLELFMCSVVMDCGHREGFLWLIHHLSQQH
ncbi:ARF/SAR [Cladochytrium replicatum]|nr:ARF/SAR [Cladochytrium replicatum]